MSNGYAFKLDSKTITLPEAAEWISMERLCCPLLTLQLSAAGNQAYWVLILTGPEGVKPLLDAEFPTPRRAAKRHDGREKNMRPFRNSRAASNA